MTVACWDPDRLAPDLDPPRRDRPQHDPSCDEALDALIELLRSHSQATRELTKAVEEQGLDYDRAVGCLVAEHAVTLSQ